MMLKTPSIISFWHYFGLNNVRSYVCKSYVCKWLAIKQLIIEGQELALKFDSILLS